MSHKLKAVIYFVQFFLLVQATFPNEIETWLSNFYPKSGNQTFVRKHLNCSCSHCYFVVDELKLTLVKASSTCRNLNTELLALLEEEELLFLRDWLNHDDHLKDNVGDIFTSATAKRVNDTFCWDEECKKKVSSWTNLHPVPANTTRFRGGDRILTVLNKTKGYILSPVFKNHTANFICQMELKNSSCLNPTTNYSSTIPQTTTSKVSTVTTTTPKVLTVTTTTPKVLTVTTTTTMKTMSTECLDMKSPLLIDKCDLDLSKNDCNITQLAEAMAEKGNYINQDRLHVLSNKLSQIQSQLSEDISHLLLLKYFKIQSDLINITLAPFWHAMGSVKVYEEVTKLTNLVQDNTKWLCRRKHDSFNVSTENMLVRFEVAGLSFFENKRFVWDNGLNNSQSVEVITPKYIPNDNGNNFALVGALYQTLHCLLNNSNNKWKIESPIFTLKIANEDQKIDNFPENDTILITLPVLTFGQHNLTCGFLHDNSWSTKGCTVKGMNSTHINCSCTHLTSFALLMAVNNDYEKTDAEFILSLICGSISIICEVLTVAIFQCFQSLWTLRATITKNLCITLSLGTILLLTGMEHVSNTTLCFGMAIALHYFYLSAFTWMGIEGHCLYVLLVKVFQPKNNYKTRYYLIGYGFPAVVVIFSAGIEPSGYGNEKYCWLRMNGSFSWVFLGPVLFIIVLNVIFLALAIRSASSVNVFKDDNSSTKMRKYIKGAVSLTTLLGITWIFGYFNFLDKTKILTYIFIILNGLQGLFIFVFHCASNENVKRVLVKKVFDNLVQTIWKHQLSTSDSAKTQTSCDGIRLQKKLAAVTNSNSSSSGTSDIPFSISASSNNVLY